MKFSVFLTAICTALLGLTKISCDSHSSPESPQSFYNSYLHLPKGSVWVYQDHGRIEKSLFWEVKDVGVLENTKYAEILESECSDGVVKSTRVWRFVYVSEDEIYGSTERTPIDTWRSRGSDSATGVARGLLFRTNANVGDQWFFDPNPDRSNDLPPPIGTRFHVTLERRGEFVLSNGRSFSNCLVFYTDQHEDGVIYVLAQGVGLVALLSNAPGGQRYELCAYMIQQE